MFYNVDYQEGFVAYWQGDRDSGLTLMAKAAENGYWIQPPSPFQVLLYEEPEFKVILDNQAVRQALERKTQSGQ